MLRTVETAVIYLWDHITGKAGHPACDDNTQKCGLDHSGLVAPINVYLCLQVFQSYLWVLPPALCVIKLLCTLQALLYSLKALQKVLVLSVDITGEKRKVKRCRKKHIDKNPINTKEK